MEKTIIISMILISNSFAADYDSIKQYQEDKPVELVIAYEETTDCDKPSVREKVYDSEGRYVGEIIKSPCE